MAEKLTDAPAREVAAPQVGEGHRAASPAGEAAAVSTFDESPRAVTPKAASSIADSERALPEERPGQYTRLGELGRGGQSIVHRALDEFVGREVALKEMLPVEPGDDSEVSATAARARFLREARLTAQLDHPNIVAVHEVARQPDGTLFCAQKLVRGETLKARLARCTSLKERLQLLTHLTDACHAVAYAHSRGVVHRDLKPSNIMVGAFGETVVVDWGLAKKRGEAEPRDASPSRSPAEPALTVAGVALGTPAYMSPEQARGQLDAIDERSDVFSLGAILYELLTARRPFEGADSAQVMAKVLEGRVAPVRSLCPEAPVELVAVAERALQSAPAARYPGAKPLAQELSAYQTGGRVQAYEYGSLDLLKRFVARNRAFSAVSVLALAVLIAASAVIEGQLRSTRATLAAAFIDRAQAAERDLDWGRAAGFYAASRVQRDSLRARWGVALNLTRMPARTVRALDHVAAAAVDFLSDGRAVLFESPGDGSVVAEAVDSGRELWRATLPSPVTSFRPGGGIVVAFYANTERWRGFDAATGRPVADGPEVDSSPCLGAPGPPRALWRVTPGGYRLEATRASGPVVLAETIGSTQGKCAVNGDGTRLAAYLAEEGSMVVWDLETLKPTLRKRGPLGFPTFTRHGLAVPAESSTEFLGGPEGDFSIPGRAADSMILLFGEGRFIASATAAMTDVLDLGEQRMTATFGTMGGSVAVADDGSRMLGVAKARPVELESWTIPRPASLQLRTAGPEEGVVAFSADGSRFATASISHDAQPRIEVWTREGSLVRTLSAEWLPGTRFHLSGDGSRLTVVSTARRAAVWDVAGSARLLEQECFECFTGVVPALDGSVVLAVSTRHEVALWDVARRERRWRVPARDDFVAGAALSDDGALAAWIDELSLIIAEAGSGATRVKVPFDRHWSTGLAFSHDGKQIAAAGPNGVSVWRVDGSFIWSSPGPIVKPFAGRVLWSLDDSKLILGDTESSILDSVSGEVLARIDPEVRSPQPHGFVSPDLRYVVKKGRTAWSLERLPAPEEAPPARELASILEQTGRQLRGAELVPED